MNYRLIKKCWMPLAILVIAIAILFSMFRALTPFAKQYKGDVEHHLSRLIGQPVEINSMETSWYWFEPVLRLNQVKVVDSQDHVLQFKKLLVGIDLLSSLWHWHLQPGILYVDDAHFTLRQTDDSWQIDGLRQDKQVTLEPDLYLPILGWLLGQQKVVIKNVSAMVHLKNGVLVPLSALNLTAVNRSGHYRLQGSAKLAQTMATELVVLADLKLNPYALNDLTGQAYLSLHRLLPGQWQDFFPEAPYHIESGKGGMELWFDVAKGKLTGLQTRFDFRRLAYSKQASSHHHYIQSLRGNLAWKPLRDGWQLTGDKIKFRADSNDWPENSFQIENHSSKHLYRVFVQNLLLEPLLAAEVEWPQIMKPVLAVRPTGTLHDTQIEMQEGQVSYVLTRFTNLSWQNIGTVPAVSHLSGVLSWQPTEGRLDLDSEEASIAPRGYKPITFTQANASLEWKELSQGLRVSMERLVLSHPALVLSARGALDEPFSPTRKLRLSAEFSAKNAEQWLAYVPSQYVKAKLDDWLKHDITRIDKASGQLTIEGALADFPFDKEPGEFSIVSRLSGVDLFFNKNWPISRDIDAYLRVKKRSLEADILQASLQDVFVDSINLRVDDLGLDKETLLLHGKVEAPAEKALGYVFASPLTHYLAKLKMLDVQGALGLDLRLEVPLYPDNNDVLARGTVTFNNNELMFHHSLNDVKLKQFSGELQFDEHGVIDSAMTATLLGSPVNIRVLSKNQPNSSTEVTLSGNTTVDILREKFALPILPNIQGSLSIESQLDLTNSPEESDHIRVSSSLEGVEINLPAPFGKPSERPAPLTLDLALNSDKSLRLRGNYDNSLSSDLWFAESKGAYVFDKGEIRMGAGQALGQKRRGLRVVGSLPMVDIKQWQEALSTNAGPISMPVLEKLTVVDMKVGKIVLWGQNYLNVALNASKYGKDVWDLSIEQQDIAGDFRYQLSTNSLSGHFERLYLSKSYFAGKSDNRPTASLKPIDIPNLNVTIDALRLDAVDVGAVALKSSSSTTRWHLENCNIKSQDYQLVLKGDWHFSPKQNNTELQADLQTGDVGKSLQRWNITPAVEAHHANIQYTGGWQGGINDFSLAKNNGRVYIMLENGRITHLSPETEQKMGLGKLLSILSLQTIPRRLKLDFSDLSNNGYSFDVFKGNFALKKGVMNTTDSYIDGPVAYVSMKGDLDLVKQLYDVELQVSPHITASLPVVATIAGGPIAGVATWVASKIINQGMQTVTSYTYKVSGPWLNPVVQQVSIHKKK